MSSQPAPTWNSVTYSITVPLWILTCLSTTLIVLRFASRGPLAKKSTLGWDDAFLAVSMVTCLVGSSLLTAAVHAGTKVSLQDPAGTLPKAFVLDIAANTTYIISIPIPKIAVAILLVRIFVPSRLTRNVLIGGCVFLLLVGIAEYFMNWLECNPAPTQWNPWQYPNGKCWAPDVTADAAYALGALSATQDFALAIWPATQLKKLQMPDRRKAYLSILLGMGFVAGAFAIVKTYQLGHITGNPADPAGLFNVSLYTGLWSAIENNVVIIAACIPTVFPALKWVYEQGSRSWSNISSIALLPARTWRESRAGGNSSSRRSQSAEYTELEPTRTGSIAYQKA